MTEERKNEIWEYLPNDIRCKLQRDYIKACEAQEFDPHNDRIYAHRMFMQKYFGKDNMEGCKELNDYNLTAQAEEKPKEPRFKMGDKVVVASNKSLADSVGDECCVVTEVLPHGYHIDSSGKSWFAKDEDLAPYAEPKEPRFKVGDKVGFIVLNRIGTITSAARDEEVEEWRYEIDVEPSGKANALESYLIPYTEPKSENDKNSVSSRQNCENPTENGISDSKIQSESAESVETSTKEDAWGQIFDGESNLQQNVVSSVDYAQYRLDLAKEIAVAMIRNTYVADEIVENVATAANLANEIVKRLKETEI